jgi:L-threonylcarbamoyladenylate synthase
MSRADVLSINPHDPDPSAIAIAAGVIRRGGLVAFPTETVYGLGANALDDAAVARTYAAKRRDAADPLIVHLANSADLPLVAADVPPTLRWVADHFWPGPLTIVVTRHARVPRRVSAGRPTVAVRVPAHLVATRMIAAAGVPVAAPSANRFMRTSATHAAHVQADLGDAIDLILDGGPTAIGVESTVIDDTDDGGVRVLRPGAIPVEDIIAALRNAGMDLPVRTSHQLTITRTDVTEGRASPGLLQTHYAPRARLILVSGPAPDAITAMVAHLRNAASAGGSVGLLAFDDDLPTIWTASGLPTATVNVARVGPSHDADAVAHRLFAALRDLDAAGSSAIVARTMAPVVTGLGAPPVPGGAGLSRAIDDRLIRAAGSRVVIVPEHSLPSPPGRGVEGAYADSDEYEPATPQWREVGCHGG